MKRIFTILLVISPLFSFAQNYLKEFDQYNPYYVFDWNGFESSDHHEIKERFIEFTVSSHLLEEEKQALALAGTELRFHLRALDLNDDGLSDIIYQGPYMGEGLVVHLFIQTKSGYENIFSFGQGIVKVLWKDNKLDKLLVHDWGCCADPILTNYVFQVSYEGNIHGFELIWKSVELESLITKPKSYSESRRFEVVNEAYKLRANPGSMKRLIIRKQEKPEIL